ncbi:response regulator [Lysobacter sp. TY2-98]|uniref:hybrid sensor histidine kinase/response regulator n=1 Tax=Lysobacter sp. TY2-98 TaxID=2290922 RepID=UPI000E2061AC|nr:ATP-binding protein [Lysobacter sp. TY2-98]AXK72782.1 response regulator [Lysobacter sp. TY2-98]
MTAAADAAIENRLLLLLPTQRDCVLTAEVLARDGIATHACSSTAELERELQRGAGGVFVCEELLAAGAHMLIGRAVERQPAWSDLPVLILAREGSESRHVSDALAELGNVMLLERPLRLAALSSNVRTALRARERQYQIRRHLDDIAAARDALTETARRKDEFLAMLGHELRNPLAPVRNALHLLASDPRLPEDDHALCDMMKRQVDHMVRLVDDLIDVSRISRGTIALKRERVDLATVLQHAIDQSRPLVDAGNHTLDVSLGDAGTEIDADPVRITQVFGNLLNNAAKYAEPGGHISVRVERDGDTVRIHVRDRGIGIEPEMLPHVFELFTQGRRERHRAHDGLGIGLTLVRNLVEMHGGTVAVASEGRGHGAEFVVTLPVARASAFEAVAPAPARERDASEPARVLVVDDNVDAAESMGMVLDLLGIEHRVVFDGAAALAAMAEFRPDIVLLDIGMPGMDGCEVARRVRADSAYDGVRLVALTGWSQAQDRERTRAAGFDQHLSKPVDIGALQELVGAAPPVVMQAARPTMQAAPGA